MAITALDRDIDTDPDIEDIAAFTGTGFPARIGTNDWAQRSIEGGTGLTVTHPAGIAGNPSIAPTGAGWGALLAASAATTHLLAKLFDGALKLQTKAALKALTSPATNVTYITAGAVSIGDGWEGEFDWNSGNLSAHVTADPGEAVYVALTGQDGSTGAFVRRCDKSRVKWGWWLILANDTDAANANSTAVQRMFDFCRLRGVRLSECNLIGTVYTSQTIYWNCSGLTVTGMGPFGTAWRTGAAVGCWCGDDAARTSFYAIRGFQYQGAIGSEFFVVDNIYGWFPSDYTAFCDRFNRLGVGASGIGNYTYAAHFGLCQVGSQIAGSTLSWISGENFRAELNVMTDTFWQGLEEGGGESAGLDGISFEDNIQGLVDHIMIDAKYIARFDRSFYAPMRCGNVLFGPNITSEANTNHAILFEALDASARISDEMGWQYVSIVGGQYHAHNDAAIAFRCTRAGVGLVGPNMTGQRYKEPTHTPVLFDLSQSTCYGLVCTSQSALMEPIDASQYLVKLVTNSSAANVIGPAIDHIEGAAIGTALLAVVHIEGAGVTGMKEPGNIGFINAAKLFNDTSHSVPKRQAFRFYFRESGGNFQHKFISVSSALGSVAADPDLIDRINGASTSFTTTPSATDSSTAFAAGAKISSAATGTIILDVANQALPLITNLRATLDYTDNTGIVQVLASIQSQNVNGVTRSRLVVSYYSDIGGARNWPSDLGAGQQVAITISGELL